MSTHSPRKSSPVDVAERLRRQTANLIPSGCAGSNPVINDESSEFRPFNISFCWSRQWRFFPLFYFLCACARANTSRHQRIVFGLLLVTSVALLSLLFLCACARASPAIVSFFFVAVCFVWYASFDTPTVYTRQIRGGVTATSTGDDFLRE